MCPWEKHLVLFSIMGSSSLPIVMAQLDERHANGTASTFCVEVV